MACQYLVVVGRRHSMKLYIPREREQSSGYDRLAKHSHHLLSARNSRKRW